MMNNARIKARVLVRQQLHVFREQLEEASRGEQDIIKTYSTVRLDGSNMQPH